MTTLKTHADLIEAEALRRAAMNPEPFVEEKALKPHELRKVRLMLARRYDKLCELRSMDAGYSLAERITAEVEK